MTRGPCTAHAACYASQDFSSGIHTMRHLLACLALLPLAAVSIGTVHAQPAQPLTLDQVMADPDWIGPGVEDAWWSWDGTHAPYPPTHDGGNIRAPFPQSVHPATPAAGGGART